MDHSINYQIVRPDLKEEKLLTVMQASMRINVSKSHVYKLIEMGELQAPRMGVVKGIRLKISEVEGFIEKKCANFE